MRAVFLDRDGVLNRDRPDFVRTPEQFELLPGVAEAVASLSRAGLLVFVVTNQSGLARGFVTPDALDRMHRMLGDAVAAAGGIITGIFVCPHSPDAGCVCRKPSPYLVRLAAAEHGVDLAASFFVGDKAADIQCGHQAGCRTILVLSGQTASYRPACFPIAPDEVCSDLPDACDRVLAGLNTPVL